LAASLKTFGRSLKLKHWLAPLLALILGLSLAAGVVLDASQPAEDGEFTLPGLSAAATVRADDLGIPRIAAQNRDDALRSLGFLHARDRMFQMDLIRRKMAGRLAEAFGAAALSLDQQQRIYGFEHAARAIVAALPPDQRQALAAYVEGVNRGMLASPVPPPEYLALGLPLEPWRPEDSLMVALSMFQTLSSQEEDERMLTVMERALPPELAAFLTPDSDIYSSQLIGGPQSRRPAADIPLAAWAALDRTGPVLADAVDSLSPVAGSNNWAVSGRRSRDGRAMVANDMHLSLGVPNLWYRAELHFPGADLAGLTLPGLPLLVTGSNGHVAWGYTNVDADNLDLVTLEIDPEHPNQYRTPDGWKTFEQREETMHVKGGKDIAIGVRSTIWGPVSTERLLGKPVAVHWTALQADAIDLGLLDVFSATTLEETMAVMNRSGGPNQNVALADDRGRIAWTLFGRFPLRHGLDGSVSRGWGEGATGWTGYIPPAELPRVLDPEPGFLVTANNRTIGADYPYPIAHNQANSYRAYRIAQQLAHKPQLTEQDMLAVQLDTASEFFEFYRKLALELAPADSEIGRYVAAWNGRMDGGSLGIPLLWVFREQLADVVLAPVVQRCRTLDPHFRFAWRNMETPLRKLLEARLPETLPSTRYTDWQALLRQTLEHSAEQLRRDHDDKALADIAWGQFNRTPIQHPFSRKMPLLANWLDMAPVENGGCGGFCVRIVGKQHGASERMAVSPNHPEDGILHMPGGQSGHPLSPHYRDQQPAWLQGQPLPFLSGEAAHELRLKPGS
jgi:penicillin amidase